MKIKKRIIKGDMEDAKKITKQEKIITVIFIIVVAVISILGIIAFKNQDIVNRYVPKKEKTTKVKKDNNKKEETHIINYEDVEITEEIKELFDRVHSKESLSGDYTIFNNKKLSTTKMSEYYKFLLACNIYCPLININFNNAIIGEIDENTVKESYESLFGPNTYEKLEEIPYYNNKMHYDTQGRYLLTKKEEYGEPSLKTKEKIIQVQKNNNILYITSSVIFVVDDYNVICKDYNCEKVLEPDNSTGENYYYEYIDKNKDNLEQYIYKFKIVDNNYYYLGYEKTNE